MDWQRNLWVFVVPSFTILALVVFYPLGHAIYLSLQNYYLGSPAPSFIGLGNYVALLTDGRFWNSVSNTFIIAGGAVALEFVVGLAIALALFSLTFAVRPLTILMFLPHVVTPVVAALFLRWMFVGRWGLVDTAFAALGIVPPDWLGHPNWARLTVILADTWQFGPFMILVLYAGLQSMDRNLLEAARIDGARGWSLLWHVILPALRPLILFVLAIRLMDAWRFFDTIYVLTTGGPGTATETMTMYTYALAFGQLEVGRASALGVLTLILVSVLIGGIIMLLYRRERGAF